MRIVRLSGLGLFAIALAGCNSGPAGTGRLTFQLAGRGSATTAPSFAAGADVLTLTSVEVVARKIRLERADKTCPTEAAEGPASSSPSGSEGDGKSGGGDSDCANVWLEPRILNPPVGPQAQTAFTVDLPEGIYQELKMQVHTPVGGTEGGGFLEAHPEFDGISIKVTGTFNGAPFTFTTAVTAEVEIELDTPVEVTAGKPAAMTLQIDLGTWFAGAAGAILNPTAPSQQIRSQIEQNIRRSFHAFEDEDRDGDPD